MKEIIYLDVFFVINFLMDLVALSVGALIASEKAKLSRLFVASFAGAAFSLGVLILSPGRLLHFVLGAVLFCVTVFLAFGKKSLRRFGKICLFSFTTALFLGGAAEALSYYAGFESSRLSPGIFFALVFFSFGCFSLWGKSVNRKLETAVVSLAITFSGRSEYFFGLVDSGLLLKDPEGLRPVLLLKAEYATPLLPMDFLNRIREGLCVEETLFSIPVRTASGTGNLPAFLPERVCILKNGKRKKKEWNDVLVALDFSEGGFGGCPCLVPLSVL